MNCYTPPVDLLLSEGKALVEQLGFTERKIALQVECILRREVPQPSFSLFDGFGCLIGVARHVVLALGHPGLAWPAATLPWIGHPRVTHAYQAPSLIAGEHVVVVGSGMAAAQLWLAALEREARVVALHRRPLRRQQLNAPRCSLSASGIDAYHRLAPSQRRAVLMDGSHGSFPLRWRWEWQLWQAHRSGRFTTHIGELSGLIASDDSLEGSEPLILHLDDGTTVGTDRLICATGFQSDALVHPIIRQLVETYHIPTAAGMLLLKDDFTLPPLSKQESMCVVVGALARWALLVADTFVGIKYAVRRLAPLLK